MAALVGFQDNPYPRVGLPTLSDETLAKLNETMGEVWKKHRDQIDAESKQAE